MVGFYMRADASHVIRTDLDNELTGNQVDHFMGDNRLICFS